MLPHYQAFAPLRSFKLYLHLFACYSDIWSTLMRLIKLVLLHFSLFLAPSLVIQFFSLIFFFFRVHTLSFREKVPPHMHHGEWSCLNFYFSHSLLGIFLEFFQALDLGLEPWFSHVGSSLLPHHPDWPQCSFYNLNSPCLAEFRPHC